MMLALAGIHLQTLNPLDYAVLGVYFALNLGIGWWWARKSQSSADNFLRGGGRTAWWAAGISFFATGSSSISTMAIPATTYSSNWHSFGSAPAQAAATVIIAFAFVALLRRLNITTIFEYLEFRFNRSVRVFGAILTLLLKVFGRISVVMLLPSLALSEVTGLSVYWSILLLGGVTVLTLMVLAKFGWSPGDLYQAVSAKLGQKALEPGGLVTGKIDAVSLGLALMFGLLGLPHILMRFYTVPDAKAARTSVLYATGFIGYFYIIIPIVGFGASVLVGRDLITKIDKGGNMAAPLLAEVLGGTPFLGFIAAVAFATILAVVAGLTLAGASALSHDIYVNVVKKGVATEQEQVRVAKMATVVFGILAVLLGVLFKGQNVAFMVGLAFAVACSANFPALLMSIVWKRFTTAGAVWSILTGAFLSVLLIVISPTVWVDVLHKKEALFPIKNPAIVSMTAAFVVGILVSLMAREPSAEAMFEDEKLRTYLAVGAE